MKIETNTIPKKKSEHTHAVIIGACAPIHNVNHLTDLFLHKCVYLMTAMIIGNIA